MTDDEIGLLFEDAKTLAIQRLRIEMQMVKAHLEGMGRLKAQVALLMKERADALEGGPVRPGPPHEAALLRAPIEHIQVTPEGAQ